MSRKTTKNKLCSFLLAMTVLFSGLGFTTNVHAISEIEQEAVEQIEVKTEEISAIEAQKVFDDVKTSDEEGTHVAIPPVAELLVENTESKDTVIKEVKDAEAEDAEVEDTEAEDTEVEDTEAEDTEVEDTEVEDTEAEDTEVENVESSDETKMQDNPTKKETFDNAVLNDEEDSTEAAKDFKSTDTIVKDNEKGIWRKIKDGDFFVDIKEAIKDSTGDILGWLDGVFGKTEVGKPEKDPATGGFVQEKTLVTEDGYAPIIAEDDGSGKWTANITPDANGTTYYKVTESTKYQEREIVDGIEGELLYIQEDGTKGTTLTDKPSFAKDDDGNYLSLPGVTYDETIYYLKYVDGKLSEVKVVIPGEDNDPFKDLEVYSQDDVKKHNGKMPIRENPMDKLLEELKGNEKVHEDEFEEAGKIYNKDLPLSFNNDYDLPKTDIEIEADKNLTGKDLEDGEFEFIIKDKDGNKIGTVTNDKDGNISFNIPIDHEGEFEFILEEVKGDNANVEYDGTIYKAVVRARYDRLTNKLITELVYMDKDGNVLDKDKLPEFNNKYTPPTTPPVEPPTEPPTEPPVTPPTPEEPPVVPPTPEVPEIPEVPETPEEPEVPEVPETPEEPEVPQLPKTGIAGMTIFTASGMTLLLAGAWMMRKKK